MKVSVSLPEEDVEFLDTYADTERLFLSSLRRERGSDWMHCKAADEPAAALRARRATQQGANLASRSRYAELRNRL